MRRAATWCHKQKDKVEVILCPQSQDGMPGTQSHPTVRAAAASAVLNMLLETVAVAVLLAPAVHSAPVTPQNWPALQTQCPTSRSTASWSTPTSRACRAEATPRTHDHLKSPTRGPQSLRCLWTSHAVSLHSALPTHLLWNLTALHIFGWRPAPGQVSGGGSSLR